MEIKENTEKTNDRLKNVWNKDDFDTEHTTNIKDKFKVETELKEHSVKFYEIIKSIKENGDDLHVVYIEYKQIIIPFVRALQANGFVDFDEDKNKLFLTKPTKIKKQTKKQTPPLLQAQTQGQPQSKPQSKTVGGEGEGDGKGKGNNILKTFAKNKTVKVKTSSSPVKETALKNKYMFLTGSGEEDQDKEDKTKTFDFVDFLGKKSKEGAPDQDTKQKNLLYFNNIKNKNGKYIRIIILNSAAAEGITLKNVRFVHMLHPPTNMSRLFQIFGRAIRTCSHSRINEGEDVKAGEENRNRTVTPILYLSSIDGVNLTNDEKNYEKIVNNNDLFLPYYKILKEAAIDEPLLRTQKKQGQHTPMPTILEENKQKTPTPSPAQAPAPAPAPAPTQSVKMTTSKSQPSAPTPESSVKMKIEIKTPIKQTQKRKRISTPISTRITRSNKRQK